MARGRTGKPEPAADPGIGDFKAPRGSELWAQAIRADLQKDLHNFSFHSNGLGDTLDALVETGAWQKLNKRDNSYFTSLEDFCTAREPYGLGLPLEKVRAMLAWTFRGKAFAAKVAPDVHPVTRLPLASLRRDGGTQIRAGLTDATVAEYQAALDAGAAFPPVVVFHDGTDHWLADGFHRVAAHEAVGVADVLAEVRPGTQEDALVFATGANKAHGLPMTAADRRRAVAALVQVDGWRGKSHRDVAAHVGVSDHTVAKIREELWATAQTAQLPTATTGKDGKTRLSPGEASAAVRKLLQDPEWTEASDRKVAQHLDVSHRTVAKVRKELAAERDAAPPHEPCTDAQRIHNERVLPMGLDDVACVYEQICELAGGHIPEADRRWLLGKWQERRASLIAEEKSQHGRLVAEIRGMTIDNGNAIYTLIANARGKSQITEPQDEQLRAAWTEQGKRIRRGEHRQDLSPEMRDGRPSGERAANEDQQTAQAERSEVPTPPPAPSSGQTTLALGGAAPNDDGDSPPWKAPSPTRDQLALLRAVVALGSADRAEVDRAYLDLRTDADVTAWIADVLTRAGAR